MGVVCIIGGMEKEKIHTLYGVFVIVTCDCAACD